jgi:hypothetical protein
MCMSCTHVFRLTRPDEASVHMCSLLPLIQHMHDHGENPNYVSESFSTSASKVIKCFFLNVDIYIFMNEPLRFSKNYSEIKIG